MNLIDLLQSLAPDKELRQSEIDLINLLSAQWAARKLASELLETNRETV